MLFKNGFPRLVHPPVFMPIGSKLVSPVCLSATSNPSSLSPRDGHSHHVVAFFSTNVSHLDSAERVTGTVAIQTYPRESQEHSGTEGRHGNPLIMTQSNENKKSSKHTLLRTTECFQLACLTVKVKIMATGVPSSP